MYSIMHITGYHHDAIPGISAAFMPDREIMLLLASNNCYKNVMIWELCFFSAA